MTHDQERYRIPERPPSYYGKAILTFFLYIFGWLFGFILNIVFYNDAKRDAERYGRSPDGFGCLSVMLWWNVFWLAVFVVIVVLVAGRR